MVMDYLLDVKTTPPETLPPAAIARTLTITFAAAASPAGRAFPLVLEQSLQTVVKWQMIY